MNTNRPGKNCDLLSLINSLVVSKSVVRRVYSIPRLNSRARVVGLRREVDPRPYLVGLRNDNIQTSLPLVSSSSSRYVDFTPMGEDLHLQTLIIKRFGFIESRVTLSSIHATKTDL